ncbi:hypothetical protein ACFY1G_20590 [Streptomyces olivaceus]
MSPAVPADHPGPPGTTRGSHQHSTRSITIMNLLTDILAGLVHFVGWLV